MITRTEIVKIKPTPREIEKEIWNLDSVEQVDLILAMIQRYNEQTSDVLIQLQYVSDEFKELLTPFEKQRGIRLFSQIVEYLKEANNANSN